jgi:hypothetical protein
MDPESAIESMGSDPRHSNTFDSLRPDILRAVLDEIRRRNPLAQVYTTAGELLRAHQAENGGELPRYRIIFMKKRRGALTDAEGNPLRNAIDIPMAGGQQVLIWYDPTGASLAPEFAVLLYHGMPPDIRIVFDTVVDELIIPPVDSDPSSSRPARRQRALNRIEYYLSSTFHSTCTAIGLEQPARYSFVEVDAEEQRAAEYSA